MDPLRRQLHRPWEKVGLLFVPATPMLPPRDDPSTPVEAEYMREYITYSELFGAQPTWAQFFERLRDCGGQAIITSLSFVNSLLYARGTLNVQTDLVNGTFDSDLTQRVAQLPDWQGRVVYSPSQLLLTIKSAILESPDRDDGRELAVYSRKLNEILLIANDLIDADIRRELEVAEPTEDPDVLARRLLSHSIRATVANAADAYDTLLPRASLIFTRLARDTVVRERVGAGWMDVDALFTAATDGLTIENYFALGWAVMQWFIGSARNPATQSEQRQLNPTTFLSQTKVDARLGSLFLRLLTMDRGAAQEEFGKRAGALYAYDVVPFMERPLYAVRDDIIVPVSLAFLGARLSMGAYWLLHDKMSDSDRHRWSSFLGHLIEAYARQVIQRAIPTGAGLAPRVFPEFVYHVGKQEFRTSDVVALYPDAAIFFEVTGTRLRMDATVLTENPDAVEQDLGKIVVGKARQLSRRIDDFREGRYSFGGVAAESVPSIVPVVVTGEPLPVWTTTRRTIHNALEGQGLLRQPGVGRLCVIGIDELEMLEALARGGTDALTILRRHSADPDYRNISLRNFLQRYYSPLPRNEYLQQEYLRIGNSAAQLLFGTHLGPPTKAEIANLAYELFEARGGAHGQDVEDWLEAERRLREG